MRNRIITLAIVFVLAAAELCGCSIAGYEIEFEMNTSSGKYVLTVNGEVCTAEEARLYLCNYKNIYGTAYGMDLWGDSYTVATLESYIKDVTVDELARIYCMEQIAANEGIALNDEEKADVSQAAYDYYTSLTDAEKDYIGASQSDIESYYTRYALACKLYDEMTDGDSAEISDDEARVIRIYQIYVADYDTAEAVAAAISDGTDFVKLAASYNEASSDEVTVARGELPEEVEEVAFNLENDEVSEMIAADGGYYFIQCVNKYEEELTEANKEKIRQERELEALKQAYTDFVEESEVELNEKVWKKISLPDDLDEITTDSFFSTYESMR
ncbi:MAG: peptidyl-prolyl cis-trans isomerase [Clostridiales bacterium]|nr:peptidyl-prolyl cis-trans isomerase [Clostridiales bacterium]